MSLTSYRAAPPRVGCWWCGIAVCCAACLGIAWRADAGIGLSRPRGCGAGASTPKHCAGAPTGSLRGVGWEGLAATDFPVPCGTVSWALAVFTSEFGMGSGVDPPPWPPDRLSQPRATFSWARAPCFAARGQVLALGCVLMWGLLWQRWVAAVHGGPVVWIAPGDRLVVGGG